MRSSVSREGFLASFEIVLSHKSQNDIFELNKFVFKLIHEGLKMTELKEIVSYKHVMGTVDTNTIERTTNLIFIYYKIINL